MTQYLTKSQKSKIEKYLDENLPTSENRIAEPMDKACEVCVVIPAFCEREYILKTLLSLASQRNVNPTQYEVIIVVNNPLKPHKEEWDQKEDIFIRNIESYQKAFKNNQDTLDLIKYINNEDIKLKLNSGEEDIIRKIREQELIVYAIDNSSQGKELNKGEQNVGGARNRGAAEAVMRFYKHIKKDGIIAFTDADVQVDENYIYNLIHAFRERPKLLGLRGRIEDQLENPWDQQQMKDFLYGRTMCLYYWLLNGILLADFSSSKSGTGTISFSGANMSSRAFVIAVVGGVPRISGAEDVILGWNISKIGLIDIIPNIVVTTFIRYSGRTSTGRGYFMEKCSAGFRKNGNIYVRSPYTASIIHNLILNIRKALENNQTSVENLRKILTINNEQILNDNDLKALHQNIEKFRDFKMDFYYPDRLIEDLLNKIAKKVEEKMKPLSISEGISIFIDFHCQNSEIRHKYEEVKREMTKNIELNSAALDYLLQKIFKECHREKVFEFINSIWDQEKINSDSLLGGIRISWHLIKRISELITISKTIKEARELIEINYFEYFVAPKRRDSILFASFELQALNKALSM